MTPIVYFISGANKGIGLSMTIQLAERDNTVIFAGVRDPASAKDLNTLAANHPGKVHAVKLVSADEHDAAAAVSTIKQVAGRLDVVIANAGLSSSYAPSVEVPLAGMREHFDVNVLGPLVLFQATYPLLKASQNSKFIIISSGSGSIGIGAAIPTPNVAYAVSKAAVNFLAAKLYHEYPEIVTFPVHPGLVKTDMVTASADKFDVTDLIKVELLTPDESARAVLKVVDGAKRDESGPKLLSYDGSTFPW